MYLKSFGIQACAWLLMSMPLYSEPKSDVEYLQLPAGLVEKFSSDDFDVREKAYADLEEWSLQTLTASPELLHQAWKTSDDPEVQTRCYSLMKTALLQRKYKAVLQTRLDKAKGFLGIQMMGEALPGGPPGHRAVRVQIVLDGTPAQKVGLKPDDLILGVDNLDLGPPNKPERQQFGVGVIQSHAVSRFSTYIKSRKPGEKVTLHLLRGGKPLDVDVALMQLPLENDPDRRRFEAEFKAESEKFFQQWLEKMEK